MLGALEVAYSCTQLGQCCLLLLSVLCRKDLPPQRFGLQENPNVQCTSTRKCVYIEEAGQWDSRTSYWCSLLERPNQITTVVLVNMHAHIRTCVSDALLVVAIWWRLEGIVACWVEVNVGFK